MNYLPVVFALEFNGLTEQALRQLPEAFHILWPIFDLEDGYDCEGWTALTNAGVHGLPRVIAAYEHIGLPAEAAALKAALAACTSAPDDVDAVETAYLSVPREYEDDEDRRLAVITYMRAHEYLWERYPDN